MRPTRYKWSRVISGGGYPAAVSGPGRMEKLAARLVDALISMGAKEIPLRLQQVGGQPCGSEAVVERKRGGKCGRGHAILDGANYAAAPPFLILHQCLAEKIVEQQVIQAGVLVERFGDFAQETAADDAAAAPHQCDAAEVQMPALILRGFAQQHVTLRVGNEFRAIQRAANVFDKLFAVG